MQHFPRHFLTAFLLVGIFLGLSFPGYALSLRAKMTGEAVLAARRFLGIDSPQAASGIPSATSTREFLASIGNRYFPPGQFFVRLRESAGERFSRDPSAVFDVKSLSSLTGLASSVLLISFDRNSDGKLTGTEILLLEVLLLSKDHRPSLSEADLPVEVERGKRVLRLFLDSDGNGVTTNDESRTIPSDCRQELIGMLKIRIDTSPVVSTIDHPTIPGGGATPVSTREKERPFLIPFTPKKKPYDPKLLEKHQRDWNFPHETILW